MWRSPWIISLWSIHARVSDRLRIVLGVLPFVLLVGGYLIASDIRRRENPQDKLLPSVAAMGGAVKRLAFEPDRRTEQYTLLADTWSSIKRIGVGMGAAAILGLVFGICIGRLPGVAALLQPLMTFVSIVPPLALLPMLFVVFGVDELSKILLILIGTFPMIARDITLYVRQLPQEQVVKALTLGASEWQILTQIVLPQVIPRLLEAVRLGLGAAWLFLIAAEAIAAESGLGYRIFLVRRYLAMDVIIPYALWITLLGFMFDSILRAIIVFRYPWYSRREE